MLDIYRRRARQNFISILPLDAHGNFIMCFAHVSHFLNGTLDQFKRCERFAQRAGFGAIDVFKDWRHPCSAHISLQVRASAANATDNAPVKFDGDLERLQAVMTIGDGHWLNLSFNEACSFKNLVVTCAAHIQRIAEQFGYSAVAIHRASIRYGMIASIFKREKIADAVTVSVASAKKRKACDILRCQRLEFDDRSVAHFVTSFAMCDRSIGRCDGCRAPC